MLRGGLVLQGINNRSFGAGRRAYATRPSANRKPPSTLALIAILGVGFTAFAYVSKKQASDPATNRKGNQFSKAGVTPTLEGMAEQKASQARLNKGGDTPTFDDAKISLLFVLGGPGVGKGTQCQKLVDQKGFVHLSAGDLLRAEQKREGSQYGDLIKQYITEGKIVPMEVTVALLENAIRDKVDHGKTRFLVDGFPRKMDQAIKFEETVCVSKFTIFFDCSEETMTKRLLKRGESSGRDDDNAESIKKRFKTFKETSMPVVEYFEKQGKVVKINCEDSVEEVAKQVSKAVEEKALN
ncbi:Uridylate kinase [Taphrina deformans PYCC 5710]|uniref:Uridylate kinase n=1 Tax=Taphrina deformans (strain PYCC 5710 / ATCC 11124 / CBS 356.35 / IMI 108563 / JCM 9778 / NBRC 8474) TaxID=1097556 RepID=R4X731_TAPDE|nr:Uridylate kinase [Taphrina deformans PYCC 5710]|eukprot:CCG80858.1 Uridylate kinase [Taphrina deformans PYCC 5710]